MKNLEELVKEVPPELTDEVIDFIQFLLTKHAKKPQGQATFGWAGALRDWRHQFTSVTLQHQILKWRSGE